MGPYVICIMYTYELINKIQLRYWEGRLHDGFLQIERSPYSSAIINDWFKLLAVLESLT